MKSDLQLAKKFHSFFEAIPEEKWGTGHYELDGKCCARGHLMKNDTDILKNRDLKFIFLLSDYLGWALTAERINDGQSALFRQPTPRLRILAALDQIIEKLEKADKENKKDSSYKAMWQHQCSRADHFEKLWMKKSEELKQIEEELARSRPKNAANHLGDL